MTVLWRSLRRWFHTCRPSVSPNEYEWARCRICGQLWFSEYEPALVGVTDGVIDGGSNQWVKAHSYGERKRPRCTCVYPDYDPECLAHNGEEGPDGE